jgi:GT2 family glycosyltransferase
MIRPIDIVITTWQREWMTQYCLDAIAYNTKTPHRVILIDNGSNGNCRNSYVARADIYVKLDRNYGLEYAKNIGMQFVESDLFVSTDNDILPYKYDPDWLSQLVDLMDKNAVYGAIALRPQILVGTGNIFDGKEDQEIIDFSHVPGYMRIMRTDWVKKVGAWNDKRPLRGHEEYWIGDKFAQNSWKMGFANKIKCWHMFGKGETDKWGYRKEMLPAEHGHSDVSSLPGNDIELIREEVGIDI